MAEAEWGLLPGISHLTRLGQPGFELGEQLGLTTLTQRCLEFDGAIEMIVDRTLSPARDKEELVDAGRLGFLDRVMDERLIHHWQHFLRHRLGCRKKARSQPGDGKDGLANRFVHEPLDLRPLAAQERFYANLVAIG